MLHDDSQVQKVHIPFETRQTQKADRQRGIELTRPTLQPGTIPGPPTNAAPMLETIAPYKFGITITSNCPGRATSCIELVKKVGYLWNRNSQEADIRVVYNHIIEFDARRPVIFRDPSESIQEQAIAELHDVGFVHTCHFLKQFHFEHTGHTVCH